ncbi:mismatch repair endonuclease PMS2-like [Branchiostoma lanceolatum]|uniref:mismatch repair endonuclease PMS2-like n=1 Tax=Branchiostoma lanceolatum TaxID=7740 RepID=UPI003451F430
MAGPIQPIDRRSVHQICSGQVVLNLATAMKELVENSLDAGATNIDIRLKEYGSELLEVVDNGSGVEESNFEGLTLKHHTSKLQDFSDLTSVETFGFRGEALSSLCALSDLSITTCHKDAHVGTKLVYNHNGKLIQKTPCARQQGTTVTIQQIFCTLPVRHKEFLRNLKKEYSRMLTVLYAYCVISTNVRITCTNQAGKGKRSTVVSTNGNVNMKENVTNVFGPKQLSGLLQFVQHRPSQEVAEEMGVKGDSSNDLFSITGYLSTCCHGQGRGSADRQYYFINKRPCDLPKVSKVVNEVYHMYNRHQYPFVVLDISLARDSVDVNVTPDKRQVWLQEERTLLAIIKTSLVQMYEPTASVYAVNQAVLPNTVPASNLQLPSSDRRDSRVTCAGPCNVKRSSGLSLAGLKRSFSHPSVEKDDTPQDRTPKQRKLDTFFRSPPSGKQEAFSEATSSSLFAKKEMHKCKEEEKPDDTLQCTFSKTDQMLTDDRTEPETYFKSAKSAPELESWTPVHDRLQINERLALPSDESAKDQQKQAIPSTLEENSQKHGSTTTASTGDKDSNKDSCLRNEITIQVKEVKLQNSRILPTSSDFENQQNTLAQEKDANSEKVSDAKLSMWRSTNTTTSTPLLTSSDSPSTDVVKRETTEDPEIEILPVSFDQAAKIHRKEIKVAFSMDSLRQKLRRHAEHKETAERMGRSFRATISPTDNQAAEDELRREISKDKFTQMEILGQFNLGFIIARLGGDLFIIDQHATDEKYNFEMLQRNTVLQGQRLIQPQSLHLTAANESILMDNMDIFRKNGFEFTIKEDAPCTERVKLVSMPVSKNWTFGKEDIEELIFMLSDAPGVMCRPSRVRQMFASRSCRKSVMIGTALNHGEMRQLLSHMGEIEQPWNCPHGRPTMRHLFNLNMLPD